MDRGRGAHPGRPCLSPVNRRYPVQAPVPDPGASRTVTAAARHGGSASGCEPHRSLDVRQRNRSRKACTSQGGQRFERQFAPRPADRAASSRRRPRVRAGGDPRPERRVPRAGRDPAGARSGRRPARISPALALVAQPQRVWDWSAHAGDLPARGPARPRRRRLRRRTPPRRRWSVPGAGRTPATPLSDPTPGSRRSPGARRCATSAARARPASTTCPRARIRAPSPRTAWCRARRFARRSPGLDYEDRWLVHARYWRDLSDSRDGRNDWD